MLQLCIQTPRPHLSIPLIGNHSSCPPGPGLPPRISASVTTDAVEETEGRGCCSCSCRWPLLLPVKGPRRRFVREILEIHKSRCDQPSTISSL